jgi:hypothetical protein
MEKVKTIAILYLQSSILEKISLFDG